VLAPVFATCPDDFVVVVADGEDRANVTWSTPTATDNVGVDFLDTNYKPGIYLLEESPIAVVYTASDEAGNTATCTFTVSIVKNDYVSITLASSVFDEFQLSYRSESGDAYTFDAFSASNGLALTPVTSFTLEDTTRISVNVNAPADKQFRVAPTTEATVLELSLRYSFVMAGIDTFEALSPFVSVTFSDLRSLSTNEAIEMPDRWFISDSSTSFDETHMVVSGSGAAPAIFEGGFYFSAMTIDLNFASGFVFTSAENPTASTIPVSNATLGQSRLRFRRFGGGLASLASVVGLDITPPVIVCPENIRINAEDSQPVTLAESDLAPVRLEDNSGNVTLVQKAPTTTFDADDDDVEITLIAEDGDGNSASCTVSVERRGLSERRGF
jgi:hypothetical protein